jgi:hypothetical protein
MGATEFPASRYIWKKAALRVQPQVGVNLLGNM